MFSTQNMSNLLGVTKKKTKKKIVVNFFGSEKFFAKMFQTRKNTFSNLCLPAIIKRSQKQYYKTKQKKNSCHFRDVREFYLVRNS